ncbi:MAG: hypothetical protein AB1779_10270 [Candidatus Thermoplasmatota archaeon]
MRINKNKKFCWLGCRIISLWLVGMITVGERKHLYVKFNSGMETIT